MFVRNLSFTRAFFHHLSALGLLARSSTPPSIARETNFFPLSSWPRIPATCHTTQSSSPSPLVAGSLRLVVISQPDFSVLSSASVLLSLWTFSSPIYSDPRDRATHSFFVLCCCPLEGVHFLLMLSQFILAFFDLMLLFTIPSQSLHFSM